jgi:uncharacterized protein
MGTRAKYEPGTFCWVDLSTPDPDAAKRFYGELLGWEYDDQPVDGGVYSMARRYGADVAAIFDQEAEERAQGVPPHWNNYVSTDDADGAAARAQELGGAVLAEPFDVFDSGRIAVLSDPAGAVFCVWQPRDHIGAGHVNSVGCLTWNDLSTNDAEGAKAFYSELFGWDFEAVDTGGGPPYWTVRHAGAASGINGGMRELSPEETGAGVPPNWMPYFTVESVPETIERAKASGGEALFGPAAIGAGTIAVLKDPTSAVFSVFEGEVDD